MIIIKSIGEILWTILLNIVLPLSLMAGALFITGTVIYIIYYAFRLLVLNKLPEDA